MTAKKGTIAYKNETEMLYWGINPRTFEVEQVTLTRGGTLRNRGYSHVVHPSQTRTPAREISIVWQLTDIFSALPHMWNDAYTRQQVERLREKAAAMKAEAEAHRASGSFKTGSVAQERPDE